MNRAEHIQAHRMLHASLDELVADWIYHGKGLPSRSTIMELMEWSKGQVMNPSVKFPEEETE